MVAIMRPICNFWTNYCIVEANCSIVRTFIVSFGQITGVPIAQWVKRLATDLADRVQSPLEARSSVINLPSSWCD